MPGQAGAGHNESDQNALLATTKPPRIALLDIVSGPGIF